jgi:hypothetical protein
VAKSWSICKAYERRVKRRALRQRIPPGRAWPLLDRLVALARIVAVQPRPRIIDTMNTIFLLMAQYDAKVIIPIDTVCRDFFAPLTLPILLRKISVGEIPLPLVRMEKSQKCAKGVHLIDLAIFIDEKRAAAVKERDQICGWR